MRTIELFSLTSNREAKFLQDQITTKARKISQKIEQQLAKLEIERPTSHGILVMQTRDPNYHVVVYTYNPNYLLKDLRKTDQIDFKNWLVEETRKLMKIIDETTQASAIPNHAATHVNLTPPKPKDKPAVKKKRNARAIKKPNQPL